MSTPRHTFALPAHYVDLAVRYLKEHAATLSRHGYDASSHAVVILAVEIEQCVALQVPQTPEEQARVLTEVFGCGPGDEEIGNKA